MTISANTLFHFTKDLNTIVSILETKFYPRLCLEDTVIPQFPFRLAIPMVCFCDIPLSQIADHTSKYGNYAIGIKKDWAIKQSVTPVLYVHENSLISNTIISEMRELGKKKSAEEDITTKVMKYIDTICLMKRYQGFDDRLKRDIRYYDEREWRYVPPRQSRDQFCYLIESEYKKDDIRALIDKENEKYGVVFNPDMINSIIVEKESEILQIKDSIEKIKRSFSFESVQLLTTRILSMERIREDM